MAETKIIWLLRKHMRLPLRRFYYLWYLHIVRYHPPIFILMKELSLFLET